MLRILEMRLSKIGAFAVGNVFALAAYFELLSKRLGFLLLCRIGLA